MKEILQLTHSEEGQPPNSSSRMHHGILHLNNFKSSEAEIIFGKLNKKQVGEKCRMFCLEKLEREQEIMIENRVISREIGRSYILRVKWVT